MSETNSKATREYVVEVEIKFNREKLSEAIPGRLQELREAIESRKGSVEEWYVNLLTKILISVARVCQDLLDTMAKEALPAAAWNARNLLELWVWISTARHRVPMPGGSTRMQCATCRD
jgi:hypothetical protein